MNNEKDDCENSDHEDDPNENMHLLENPDREVDLINSDMPPDSLEIGAPSDPVEHSLQFDNFGKDETCSIQSPHKITIDLQQRDSIDLIEFPDKTPQGINEMIQKITSNRSEQQYYDLENTPEDLISVSPFNIFTSRTKESVSLADQIRSSNPKRESFKYHPGQYDVSSLLDSQMMATIDMLAANPRNALNSSQTNPKEVLSILEGLGNDANNPERIFNYEEDYLQEGPTCIIEESDYDELDEEDNPLFESLIQTDDYLVPESDWIDEKITFGCCSVRRRYVPFFPRVIDPQSKLYICWLLVVTLCYLYNGWGLLLRTVFPYQTKNNVYYLVALDYLCDLIYLSDIMVFKVRMQYLSDGFWIADPIKTKKNYYKKRMFKFDVLSLIPLDLFYFKYGINPVFRLPRLLKIQTFWEFFNRVDAVARSPYAIRIMRTLIYMMFLIHLNACAYYAMSVWEGIGTNGWVFQGVGNAYIRCFYFATKTATSIGKNPKPTNEYEYAFMTFSWLMGVFIFAFLIGQVRDIVATATQNRTQFRRLMDNTVKYMRNLNIPDDLQRRVRLWLNHTWEHQKTFNEGAILDSLPKKMKTDIAIQVHYNTLVKVQLFKDCDKALLLDLVLKLNPVLFLPNDYICKKGEIGKEMYIVNKGLVQVKGGESGNVVLATLSEGSVFGEISLLGIPGYNRRTANVQSKGFSNLFVLSKTDLWDALKVYPDAQNILRGKAQNMIRQNEAFQRKYRRNLIKTELNMKPKDRSSSRQSSPGLKETILELDVDQPSNDPEESLGFLNRSSSLPETSGLKKRTRKLSDPVTPGEDYLDFTSEDFFQTPYADKLLEDEKDISKFVKDFSLMRMSINRSKTTPSSANLSSEGNANSEVKTPETKDAGESDAASKEKENNQELEDEELEFMTEDSIRRSLNASTLSLQSFFYPGSEKSRTSSLIDIDSTTSDFFFGKEVLSPETHEPSSTEKEQLIKEALL